MKKLIVSFVLILVLSLGACGKTSGSQSGTSGNVEMNETVVWAAPSTEKVLQNDRESYTQFFNDKTLDIFTARNEFEGGQIIISACEDISSYSVEIGSISSENKDYDVSNISVYHEKYTHVARNYEGTTAKPGMYPDAILPFDSAVKSAENKVKSGENQGIYLTFYIPENQEEGLYTGTLNIKANDKIYEIELKLYVYDFMISKKTHSKSVFLTEWPFYSGELDSTQNMFDAYSKRLYEYRLAPHYVVSDSNHSDDDIAYYVEKAWSFLQHEECSNVCIPYKATVVHGESCIDEVIFKKYLNNFLKKSIAENFNIFDKLTCYFNILDEPEITGRINRVKVNMEVYNRVIKEFENAVISGNTPSPLKEEIAKSVRNLRCVITCKYREDLASYNITWCPTVDLYDSDSEKYKDQDEKWWYTCIGPKAPYPTFHIEDTLISARAMGWMMNTYDVVGNLYWAVNIYANYEGGSYKPIEDYYGQASHFPNINGDGYLFYPGGQYGLDEPVASIRLEAIRDGLEEYEIGYRLKELYEKLPVENGGEKLKDIYGNITAPVYSGTRVNTTNKAFMSARKNLYQLAQLAECPANVCITSFKDDGYGKCSYEIYAKDGYELKNNGKKLNADKKNNGYNIYNLIFDLNKGNNIFNISVNCDGKDYSFYKYLGGKVNVYNFEKRSDEFEMEGSAEVVGKAVDAIDGTGGKWLQLSLGQPMDNGWQNFRWTNEEISLINENTSKMIIHIWYDGDDQLQLTLSAKYKKVMIYSDIGSVILKKGMNKIEITNLDSFSWEDKLGNIQYLVGFVGSGKGYLATDKIYFTDMAIYNV